jgi:REP element-mobilizing transposase RayT
MQQLEMGWGQEPARKPTPQPVQLSMAHVRPTGRGGRRANSGRKPGLRPTVLHRERGEHRADRPVLITLRRAKTMSSLRTERAHRILRETIRATQRDTFRIIHYTVQDDHLHLIVEAENADSLSNAMRSFTIRAAVRINYELFGRRQGRVWTERYRMRELSTPSEARGALRFVLANDMKHGNGKAGARAVLDGAAAVLAMPRTWLMRDGWATAMRVMRDGARG